MNPDNNNENESTYDEIDGDFSVLKALGKGYTSKVLLTIHKKTNTPVAIKIYKPRKELSILEQEFENEVISMKKVNHPNVLKIYAASNVGVYKYSDNRKNEKQIIYLGVEVCPNKEIFDYIKDVGKGFNEKLARFYFHQMVEGVEAIHKAGLAHRDLKTENMFLDANFNLKIGDFGFAKFIQTNDGSSISKLSTYLGTPGYQSPQLVSGQKYDGFSNDIFGLGVILFILHVGSPPFREAKNSDPWYRNYLINSKKTFWNYHLRKNNNLSVDFVELIDGLITAEESQRFTIEKIKNCNWYKGEISTPEEVFEEMSNRKKSVTLEREKDEESLNSLSSDGAEFNDGKYRDENSEIESLLLQLNNLELSDSSVKTWNHNDNQSGNYFYLSENASVAYKKMAIALKSLFPKTKTEIILDQYEYLIFSIRNKEEESSDQDQDKDKGLSNIIEIDEKLEVTSTGVDLQVQVFNKEKGCVVQLFKNEAMSQFDFKNVCKRLKNYYN